MAIIRPLPGHVLNLTAITSATFDADGGRLCVHCGEDEPRIYQGNDATAVWAAIRGHVAPSPGVISRTIEGFEDMLRRIAALELQSERLEARVTLVHKLVDTNADRIRQWERDRIADAAESCSEPDGPAAPAPNLTDRVLVPGKAPGRIVAVHDAASPDRAYSVLLDDGTTVGPFSAADLEPEPAEDPHGGPVS